MKTPMEQPENKSPKPRRPDNNQASGVQAPGVLGRQQELLSRRISTGAVMTAQRKTLDRMTAVAPVQRQGGPEDEEMLQGQFIAQHQPEEEEELMQGNFTAAGPQGENTKNR